MVSTPKQAIAADKIRVNLSLPLDLVQEYDDLAMRNMTTRTEMVRRAMLACQSLVSTWPAVESTNSKVANVILPRDLVEDYDILAARNGTYRSDLVQRALRAYLAQERN